MVQFSQEYIKEFLRQMYDGEITVENLPPSLYHGIADYLKSGLQKGFGMVDKEGQVVEKGAKVIDTPDIALYEELRENIYMFSAAKTYQEVREISSLLTDGDRVRTRDEFNKIGRETFDKWNTDWARSEYTTAVGQASMALKWNDIEKNKDILPILVFSTNGSGCEECAPYDGFAAPVDDPIWDWLFPLLHFNCMCIVLQQEEGYPITEGEDYDRIAAMKDNVPDVFQMNSGRDKVIFSDEHPYFDIAKKDIDLAKDNFGLPIPPISEEISKVAEFTPAKTIEEADKFIKEKHGVFYQEASRGDSLNLNAKNAINERLDYLLTNYDKSGLSQLGYVRDNVTYAQANSRSIQFNPKFWNNLKEVEEKIIKDIETNWLFKGDSNPQRLIDHEFAHVLTGKSLKEKGSNKLKDEIFGVHKKYVAEMKETARSGKMYADNPNFISKYGHANIDEFTAEAFSMALNSDKPSKYAVEIKNIIDNHFAK